MKKSGSHGALAGLGDFTTNVQVISIAILAVLIGFIASWVAWLLLKLIGFFTNVFYYQRIDTALSSPAHNHLGGRPFSSPLSGR